MRTEWLPDGHEWMRIADPSWSNPLDPGFAAERGGRWNPPHSFPTLYLNEDLATARSNLERFIESWPYEPEDLRNETGPILVQAVLPRRQRVADCHTAEGVGEAGLPATYPRNPDGTLVAHEVCRRIGSAVHEQRLRGVRARSARTVDPARRELAWFPAGASSRARPVRTMTFAEWY